MLWKLLVVQAKLFWREPLALFFTLAFPVLMLLMFGMLFGNEPNDVWYGFGYIDSAVPGLIGLVIGTIGLMGIPIAVATAREQRILRRFRASPLPAWHLLVADVAVNVVIAAIGVVLLTVVGLFAFGLRFGGNPLEVLVGFLLCALSFCSVGYVVASIARTARTAQIIGQLIFFPMMFLSGATFPAAMMPEGVRTAAKFLPLTHVVELLQNLWFGRPWGLTHVAVLTGMMLIGAIVSARLFRWE